MKLQITHLKAPWPEGAVVGDVLDFPAVPVWAVGKCKQVEDDAPEAVFVVNPDEAEAKPEGPPNEQIGSGVEKPAKGKK